MHSARNALSARSARTGGHARCAQHSPGVRATLGARSLGSALT